MEQTSILQADLDTLALIDWALILYEHLREGHGRTPSQARAVVAIEVLWRLNRQAEKAAVEGCRGLDITISEEVG